MKVKQLSIFLENKIGSLHEIMEILSKANIRIIAATVADTSDYGILRLITSDTDKACDVLKHAHKSSNKAEVFALSCDSSAGSFYDKLKNFSVDGVIIEYMYCFSIRERAFLIIRVNDNEKAEEIIKEKGLKVMTNEDLNNI